MTTGRINQVAILGHTSGTGAACSDSTLSARLQGRAPPTGLPDPKRTRGTRGPWRVHVGHGQRPDDSRMQNGRAPAGGPLCGTARPPPRRGVAGRAPPHRVPLRENQPANTRLNGTMQAAERKHAVDMRHLGPKNVGEVEIRGAPTAGSVPRTRLRLPRTGRRDRDASDAVLIVLHATSRGRAGARHGGYRKHGSPVSRRAPPRRGPRAAPPGTKPVGSAVARFRLGTHGFETLRIYTSRT